MYKKENLKKIVLVDDDERLLETLKEYLEMEKDFKCVAFSEPKEALRYISENVDTDVVVSDLQMPKMDGIALAKEVLAIVPTMNVIIQSGYLISEVRICVSKAGLDKNKVKVVSKINIRELAKVIREVKWVS